MSFGLDVYSNTDWRDKEVAPPHTVFCDGKGKYSKGKEKEKAKWFVDTNDLLQKAAESRITRMVNNLLWYTGEYDRTLEYRAVVPGQPEQVISRKVLPRIFNHLYDITEQRTSRLSRYKPGFDVVPTNIEEGHDRSQAKLIRKSLDATRRRVHIDLLMQNIERWNCICGEVLVAEEWNSRIGDRKEKGSIERIGDVDIYLKPAWTYFPEPTTGEFEPSWAIDIWKICHYKKAQQILKDNTIKPDGKQSIFTFNSDVQEKRSDEVVIYRIIQLPDSDNVGFICYVVNDVIIEHLTESPYPYEHGEFPWEKHTDIEVPGRQFAMSFYEQLKPLQHAYNRLTSIMIRNALLVGHPHLLLPQGSGVSKEQFGNAPTAIPYNPVAGAKPEIVTFGSISGDYFQFRAEIKQELGQISGIHGISRDNPPPGTRSASMYKFLEEQEEQRSSTMIIKHNELIRKVYKKAASIIAQYYPVNSPDRLIRVVGKSGEYKIQTFNETKISTEYDVIIQNSTGFSESMSGRLEELQLINQIERDSGQRLLSAEQKIDVLELKDPQKIYDVATASLKNAEQVMEIILDGNEPPPPKRYWDLITHWKTFVIAMNGPDWIYVEQAKQKKAEVYLATIERYIMENTSLLQRSQELPGFPLISKAAPQLQEPQAAPGPQAGPMLRPQAIPRGNGPSQVSPQTLAESIGASAPGGGIEI